MLIGTGVVLGIVYGLWAACLWGLRKARRVGPELLLVVLMLCPVVGPYGAELFGWPTPVSIAVAIGVLDEPVDKPLLGLIKLGTAVVVAAVLVKAGAMRRVERWASASEAPAQSALRPRPTTEPPPPSGSGPGVPPPR